MKAYKAFYFESYEFEAASGVARMHYSLDHEVHFTDEVTFEFELAANYSRPALDRVLRSLWLMTGVSYLKTALPPKIVVEGTTLTQTEAAFFSKTYRLGLGQLCYENGLSLDRVAVFPAGTEVAVPVTGLGEGGDVVALGGGKDSLVATTVLEAAGHDFATFSATYAHEAGVALAQLGEQVGRPFLAIKRRFDPVMLELNKQGAYNGHVPVTAVIAFIGLAAAVLTGRRRAIFSNESSAGEGSVTYEGVQINHQYSKSLEFERELREYIRTEISPDLDCFSLLRPLGELRIAELFCAGPMRRYTGQFTSCNRSFRHGSTGFTWCGECPKCAFVFLAFGLFVPKDELVVLFGENLLAKPGLEATYRELLGLTGHKPFECVGEIEECRQAARELLATGNYPEVERFGVPDGSYNWRQLKEAVMPAAYRQLLDEYMEQATV